MFFHKHIAKKSVCKQNWLSPLHRMKYSRQKNILSRYLQPELSLSRIPHTITQRVGSHNFFFNEIPFDFLSPQGNWWSTETWVTSIGIHLLSCLHCVDVYVFIITDEEAWKQVSCKCMLLLNLFSSSSNNLWKENIYNFGWFWKGNNYQKFWLFCLWLQIHCLCK